MKYTCIYCKKEKEESEFNREHVVPQMMGRYVNAPVLSNHEVCQECNSYFSEEVEGKIALDSYEALLRMKSGIKRMSDGRRLSDTRISLSGAEGLFKGLTFHVVSDAANTERIRFEISPCIGIKRSADEYDYYSLDEVPEATAEKLQMLKEYESPIIQFECDPDEATRVLREKGYITQEAKYSVASIEDEHGAKEFTTSIKFTIDSLVRRVCAKTIFNYLCYSTSAADMLDSRYDALREYIRNGVWNNNLWFRYSLGFVSTAVPPNATAHALGTMIYCNKDAKMWELLGCVTWFGEITYIMKICDLTPYKEQDIGGEMKVVVGPYFNTEFLFFDNETGNIKRDDAVFIYGGR